MYKVNICFYNKLNSDIKEIREKVFSIEQGFNIESEFDNNDDISTHVLAYYKGIPVGTARVFKSINNEEYHIGRVAVLKDYRKFGIGRIMISELENFILNLGGNHITLSSQIGASKFYERMGYAKIGNEYFDEHCLHINMIKMLRKE